MIFGIEITFYKIIDKDLSNTEKRSRITEVHQENADISSILSGKGNNFSRVHKNSERKFANIFSSCDKEVIK